MQRLALARVFGTPPAAHQAGRMEENVKLRMLGLLGALIFAAPVAAVAAPAGGLTAQTAAPAIAAPAIESNAAATPGTTAKIEKVWWRGRGWGWRGRGWGWRGGYGWRGYGWRGGYGWRRGWGWRRRYWW